MTWFGILLVIVWIYGGLYTISQIGRPREAYTNTFAVIQVIIICLLVLGVLTVGTGSL